MGSRSLIFGGLVLASADTPAEPLDIVVEGNLISSLTAPGVLDPTLFDDVVDASGFLVSPGLVNAHHHSHDRFDRGRFGPLPLEIWMGLYNPPTVRRHWTRDEIYLRTLMGGMEMMRHGATAVIDDVHTGGDFETSHLEAVFRAYDDLGMRADVGIAYSDLPFQDTIPHLSEVLPSEMHGSGPAVPAERMLEIWSELADAWGGRVRSVLSTSGPQRCTDAFQVAAWSLAETIDRPVLTHVLETAIQAMTAQRRWGRPMIEHMDLLGIVNRRTVMMHGIWARSGELDIVAARGAAIVHNPASNLKLGSGVAAVMAMLDRDIAVALGTDNHNANDGCSMFEAVKLSVLLQSGAGPDPDRRWPTAADGLSMATRGGARAMGMDDRLGRICPGAFADLMTFDLEGDAFIPLNDVRNQLALADPSPSLRSMMVDGRWVVRDGRFLTVDEDEVRAEIRQRLASMHARVMDGVQAGDALAPYLIDAHRRCMADVDLPHSVRATVFPKTS